MFMNDNVIQSNTKVLIFLVLPNYANRNSNEIQFLNHFFDYMSISVKLDSETVQRETYKFLKTNAKKIFFKKTFFGTPNLNF